MAEVAVYEHLICGIDGESEEGHLIWEEFIACLSEETAVPVTRRDAAGEALLGLTTHKMNAAICSSLASDE